MAEKTTLEPLTADEYAKIFASYQTYATDEYVKMIDVISPFIQRLNGKQVALMSIGAGNGCFEEDLINNKGLRVKFFHAVEPDNFRRKELAEVVPKWQTEYFIDERGFDDAFETENKFDVILMSHVLYCLAEPVKAIRKAISFLNPGGSLVIINQTEVGMNAVQNILFEVAHFKSAAFNDHQITTASISSELHEASIPHVITSRDAGIDVTDFVQKKQTPTSGDATSFFIQTSFEKLPEDMKSRVYEAVKQRSKSDGSGRTLFTHGVGMIEIKY